MWTLLVLFWLHQTVSVYAESKLFVRIARVKEEDSLTFYVPRSNELCSRQNVCSNRFNANLSPKASERKHCLMCSCSRQKTATFGVKNGSWQCIDNKEIRQRELADCHQRIHFINETEKDPLRMFKENETAALNINFNTRCSGNAARFSYQACNGGWISLNNTGSAGGLQVTKQWTQLVKNYMLRIDETKRLWEGKVIKAAIPCGPMRQKQFCLLFKVAGVMECPLKQISAPRIPLTTTTTTISTTKAAVHSSVSEAVPPTSHIIATKIRKSQTIPTATKAPKTTFKVTHPWATDGDFQTLNEASQVPVPLIAGITGSALIVLLVAFFVALLKCRKGKERHLRESSTSLELKVKKPDDSIDQCQCTVAEEKALYQSLSPSPDGVLERGVYVSRYKVPGTIPAINNCRALPEGRDPCSVVERPTEKPASDEYDYAESSLVVRNNLLKIDFPVSKEKVSSTLEDNAPYYRVLEVREEGLQSEEPSEGTCGKPEESAPSYQVLEGPNPMDPQDNLLKQDEGGAHVDREIDPYYHILEGSTDDKQKGPSDGVGACYRGVKGPTNSLDNEEYCGYKELRSDGRMSKDYQALHKYAYVTIGHPGDSR